MNTNKSVICLKNKLWAIALSLICLLAVSALAGDLTVDKLTVEDDAVFYSKVVISPEVTVGSVPTNGLVLYYTFDTNENGIVTDQSGNNHTGTVNGATYTSGGKIGGAYDFDAGDYINVGSATSLSPIAVTQCAWVNVDTLADYKTIIGKHSSSSFYTWLYVKANGKVGYSVYASAAIGIDEGNIAITPGIWNHVCMTYNSTDGLRGYINGLLDTNASANGDLVTGSAPLWIGNYPTITTRGIDGKIDEVMIFNRSLSTNEIYNLYLYNGTNFPPASLTVSGDVAFTNGIKHTKPLGDLLMGVYTNNP